MYDRVRAVVEEAGPIEHRLRELCPGRGRRPGLAGERELRRGHGQVWRVGDVRDQVHARDVGVERIAVRRRAEQDVLRRGVGRAACRLRRRPAGVGQYRERDAGGERAQAEQAGPEEGFEQQLAAREVHGHWPIPTTDGERQAITKVDLSASEAESPLACADWKCSPRIESGVASRPEPTPISVCTKSAMAASGEALDQRVPGPASISLAAKMAQTFSMPVRKKRFGSLSSTGSSAPRLYASEGSTRAMNCTALRSCGTTVFTSSPHASVMPSRFESAPQRWSRRETGNTSPLCETVLVGAR